MPCLAVSLTNLNTTQSIVMIQIIRLSIIKQPMFHQANSWMSEITSGARMDWIP